MIMKFATLIVLIFSLMTNLVGCGTVLHPERKGQISGRLDPGIIVLNGIGLFLFFVPGVIAFAIDFTNGTIYLPGRRAAYLSPNELETITTNGSVNVHALNNVINARLGTTVSINDQALQTKSLHSISQLPSEFISYSEG
jgi:hypothetical protein